MKPKIHPIFVSVAFAAATTGLTEAQVFFEGDPSIPNVNAIANGTNVSTVSGTAGNITVSGGGSTQSLGLASQDNINTLLTAATGSPLTIDDTIVITIEIASVGNIGYNGIELGLSSDGTTFRPAGNMLFRIDDAGNISGLSGGNAEGVSQTAAGFGFTEESLSDGFLMTLTADKDGYTYFFSGIDDGNGATTATFSQSYVMSDFLTIFGNGHIYSTVQQGAPTNYSQFSIALLDTTDTDGDGMFDTYEDANGLDKTVNDTGVDTDMDGLTNLEEFNAVPQLPAGNPDVDGDGLLDGEEVNGTLNPYNSDAVGTPPSTPPGLPTDPFVTDSDGDGVSDFEELDNGNGSVSNPLSNDTDDDGLLDGFEVLYDLDPTSDVGEDGIDGDPDGDTVDNFNEQEFGLNPRDADTDDDDLPDGGDFSMGQLGELDTTDALFPTLVTDPLDPDTDDDKILDGEEVVAGADGYVTDPNLVDTDGDSVPDYYEALEDTDPSAATGAGVSPMWATVTWSVEELDALNDIRADGTLLYAENFNGGNRVYNGVPFSAAGNDSTPRCTENVITMSPSHSGQGAFYQGPISELGSLLDGVWFGGAPQILLTGLEVGEDYFIQIMSSEDRTGPRIDRYLVVDGFGGNDPLAPIGEDNTIIGGPENPALIFTGEFTATLETQMVTFEQFETDGTPTSTWLQGLQVRIDDGTLPNTGDIVCTAIEVSGSTVNITFDNLNPSSSYRLVRSANLQDNFPDVVDGPRMPAGASEVFTDSAASGDEAFYRLEEVD